MTSVVNPYAKPKRKATAGGEAAAGGGGGAADEQPAMKKAKGSKPISELALLIRHFTSKICPGFDKDSGRLYTTQPGKRGRDSVNSRTYYPTSQAYLKAKLPNAPFWHPPSPQVRAQNLRGDGVWTKELQTQVMRVFMVPADLRILLVCPEITHYDVLRQYNAYRCSGGGVKPPCCSTDCPNHGKNEGVSLKEWTAAKGDHGIRMAASLSGERIPIVSATWLCTHRTDDSKQTTHSFSLTTKAAWAQYPESVRRQHLQHISLEMETPLDLEEKQEDDYSEEEKEKEIGIIPCWDLCYYLMTAVDPPTQVHGRMKSRENQLRLDMRRDYQHFITNEEVRWNGPRAGQLSIARHFGVQGNSEVSWNEWPVLDLSLIDKYFDTPSKTWILALEKQQFKFVAPFLRRDLLNRPAEKILRWDGTYKIMTKTLDSPDAEAPALVLLLVLGLYGNVLFWAFADSEEPKHWQKIMLILADRTLRLDPTGAASKDVVAIYSDTCCESLKDPTKHWSTKIFPNVKRAPYHDNFHSQNMVTGSMNKMNPLFPAFCAELSKILLTNDERTERVALSAYMKDTKSTLTRELAKKQMLQKPAYKASIMRYPEPNSERISRARSLAEKYKLKDKEHAEAAKVEDKKYARLYSKQVEGKQRGTEYEIENLCRRLSSSDESNVCSC